MWEFLRNAVMVFDVQIFSSRSNQPGGIEAMRSWFVAYCHSEADFDLVVNLLKFPKEKPPAFIGIDDRVVTFTGTWPRVTDLYNFAPWNKRGV
jgi:hypothetical protein